MTPPVLVPGLLCDERLWRHQVEGLAGPILVPDVTGFNSVAGMARSRRNRRPGALIVGAVGAGGEDGRALARKNASGHRWIAAAGRQRRSVARWGYTRMADLRVSTTDPDASPMHQKN